MRIRLLILNLFLALIFLVSSSLTISLSSNISAPLFIKDKTYQVEDTVEININLDVGEHSLYELLISATNNSYTYKGTFNPVMFFYPTEEGIYTIALVEKSTGAVFYSLSFDVYGESTNLSVIENNGSEGAGETGLIYTDKEEYVLGEHVHVFIEGVEKENIKLYHSFDGVSKKYMGDLRYIDFVPLRAGEHQLILKDLNDKVLSTCSFEVNLPVGKRILKIINSKGVEEKFDLKVFEEGEEGGGEVVSLEITPPGSMLKKIKLNRVRVLENQSLGLEEVPLGKINIRQRQTVKAFALDPSQLDFANGTAVGVAVGSELWKCRDWDFGNQECSGAWQKIMDLTSGQEYNIEITADDPGYAETGVASVNTKKPIYHPNERADIIMVVLDRAGRLVSNADVTLTITSPNNQATTLTSWFGDIVETERGIYETSYNSTSQQGNYSLDVRATGNNVDSAMHSFFTVKSFYEFDILRSTPVVADPWKGNGAFNSSIRIVSYLGALNFDFTEVLPGSFTITDVDGASRTTNNNQTYLRWSNLNNNSVVSYSAKPPLVSPELYEIGPSFVTYNSGNSGSRVFYEARPWYLAVDPSNYYDPDSNVTMNWDDGTSTSFTAIDEGVRYPTTVGMSADYVAESTQQPGGISEFGFPAITENPDFINNMTLWVFTTTGSSCSYTFYLMQGVTPLCSRTIASGVTDVWRNCNWTSVSGDLSSLTIQLSTVSKGAGGHTTCTVYEAYLEVNYRNPPNISSILVDDSVSAPLDEIDLNAGTTRPVYCNVTAEDGDGYTDIIGVNATFYSTTTTYDASDSNRTHYSNSSCSLISGAGQTADYLCAFNVWYYAINGSWNCTAFVRDSYDSYNASYNTNVNQLFAINVSTNVINYGNLAPNQTSPNITVNISNVGNMDMNISVFGFGGNDSVIGDGLSMICEINNISVEFERYAISDSVVYNSKNQLSSTPADMGLTTLCKTSPSDANTNSTYWQFMVPPESHTMGQCNGSVVFMAESP